MLRPASFRWFCAACLIGFTNASAQQPAFKARGRALESSDAQGSTFVAAVAPNVLRVEYRPSRRVAVPTLMMDPAGLRTHRPTGLATAGRIRTAGLTATVSEGLLAVADASGTVRCKLDLSALRSGTIRLDHSPSEHLYGMRGTGLRNPADPRMAISNGLLRDQGAPVAAGSQGDGGAPIAFSTHWGVLIDSIDGDFTNANGVLDFTRASRSDAEVYIVLGEPEEFMKSVADLTGHPPLPPKWSLGFLNTQWGTTEDEVRSIVAEYRLKQIPLDAFILDFDYKAWGEDDYGEFRWNSTSGAGNVSPDKFPNGANGKFAADLLKEGVHLGGIMKPRILLTNTAGQPTVGAKEVAEHHWFLPGEKPYRDYFSHRDALDIDFSQPDARNWYWSHARGLFETGIAGWWNDEADETYNSLGFFQMQQSLTEGQQSISDQRVWSINRNFYLGAQRLGFATWSGDIRTGFASMQAQTTRMLATIDLGQPHWSMDGGGFGGHPSAQNYARWLEFAAVCPIMRVHGTYGQKRQPWVYGPVAEAAGKSAIELRYRLLPYLYSLERNAARTGVSVVRPLFWEFPDDPSCANATDSWMLGPDLLAAPVLEQDATSRTVYLPAGTWYGFAPGKRYEGGQAVQVPVDGTTWKDVPIFVRSGAIVATQPVVQYTGQPTPEEVALDIWPDPHRPGEFTFYDDDGVTTTYRNGRFFAQRIRTSLKSGELRVSFDPPAGRWRTATRRYRVRVHGLDARTAGRYPLTRGDGYVEFVVPVGSRTVATVR